MRVLSKAVRVLAKPLRKLAESMKLEQASQVELAIRVILRLESA